MWGSRLFQRLYFRADPMNEDRLYVENQPVWYDVMIQNALAELIRFVESDPGTLTWPLDPSSLSIDNYRDIKDSFDSMLDPLSVSEDELSLFLYTDAFENIYNRECLEKCFFSYSEFGELYQDKYIDKPWCVGFPVFDSVGDVAEHTETDLITVKAKDGADISRTAQGHLDDALARAKALWRTNKYKRLNCLMELDDIGLYVENQPDWYSVTIRAAVNDFITFIIEAPLALLAVRSRTAARSADVTPPPLSDEKLHDILPKLALTDKFNRMYLDMKNPYENWWGAVPLIYDAGNPKTDMFKLVYADRDALFLFNDNFQQMYQVGTGRGNGSMRLLNNVAYKLNKTNDVNSIGPEPWFGKPRSVGIPTGPDDASGWTIDTEMEVTRWDQDRLSTSDKLKMSAKGFIKSAVTRLKSTWRQYEYKRLYYSADENDNMQLGFDRFSPKEPMKNLLKIALADIVTFVNKHSN
jgi:hypothetical protein